MSEPLPSDEGFVVLRHATNRLFVSGGELEFPLLPFGLSSPVSD